MGEGPDRGRAAGEPAQLARYAPGVVLLVTWDGLTPVAPARGGCETLKVPVPWISTRCRGTGVKREPLGANRALDTDANLASADGGAEGYRRILEHCSALGMKWVLDFGPPTPQDHDAYVRLRRPPGLACPCLTRRPVGRSR